jgi:hypothetical protein
MINHQRKVVDTKTTTKQQGLLDDNSTVEPPEPIPNSEVKRSRADGSVGFPHVRVGHRQALILKSPTVNSVGDFFCYNKFCLLSKQELKKIYNVRNLFAK